MRRDIPDFAVADGHPLVAFETLGKLFAEHPASSRRAKQLPSSRVRRPRGCLPKNDQPDPTLSLLSKSRDVSPRADEMAAPPREGSLAGGVVGNVAANDPVGAKRARSSVAATRDDQRHCSRATPPVGARCAIVICGSVRGGGGEEPRVAPSGSRLAWYE